MSAEVVETKNLSEREANLVTKVLEMLFPEGLKPSREELFVTGEMLRIASELCLKASDVHTGLQVPWYSMCYACRLDSTIKGIAVSQDMLQQLLWPLHVVVVKQDNPRRGCGYPNFVPASVVETLR